MSIHPTAIVEPSAEIDPSVEIGPYCIVDGNVRIERGCKLLPGVYVTGWTEIRNDCVLHPGVIVGHAPQDVKYGGERSFCRIGPRTVLREYVTIHRGTVPESETVVGEDCFLLVGAHVGHNSILEDRVTLINNVLLGGHVRVGRGTTFGGAAVAHQFVRAGELVMVAGCGRVVQDMPPYALTDTDGRVAGLNRVGMRRAGMTREQIDQVRTAYRILYADGVPFQERVERLAAAATSDAVQRILTFVQADSRRGLAGRSRNAGAAEREI